MITRSSLTARLLPIPLLLLLAPGELPPGMPPAALRAYARAASAAHSGDAAALAHLRESLAAGHPRPADVLADPAFEKLIARAEARRALRDLLQEFARQSRVTMVRPGEPGDPLLVDGVAVDGGGRPVAGALVYAYHTDARGIYSEQGNSNPRLFVWLRSDAEGRFAFRTIRPARYPRSEVEQHVHFVASAPGFEQLTSEIGFADDPHWRGRAAPAWARPITKGPDGVDRCDFEIRLTALPAAAAPPAAPPAAAPAAGIEFATGIRPIVDPRCGPCHFEGGIMYASLPFDRPGTLRDLGEKLFSRIQDPHEQELIRAWLAQ